MGPLEGVRWSMAILAGTPIILHALSDAEHMPVPVIRGEETPHGLATRKAREFSKMANGGFSTNLARSFQRRMWYHVYVFVSSLRREGHHLRKIPTADFVKPDILHFVAPYSAPPDAGSGAEDMVIAETPARGEDRIIDSFEELEDFLVEEYAKYQ